MERPEEKSEFQNAVDKITEYMKNKGKVSQD